MGLNLHSAGRLAVLAVLGCGSPLLGCSSDGRTDAVADDARDAGPGRANGDGNAAGPTPPSSSGLAPDAGPVDAAPPLVCTDQCHYVRAGATAPGTGADWAHAWPSLPAALTRGHVYFIGAGTYDGRAFDEPAASGKVITIRKATAGDHGTEVGWSPGIAIRNSDVLTADAPCAACTNDQAKAYACSIDSSARCRAKPDCAALLRCVTAAACDTKP